MFWSLSGTRQECRNWSLHAVHAQKKQQVQFCVGCVEWTGFVCEDKIWPTIPFFFLYSDLSIWKAIPGEMKGSLKEGQKIEDLMTYWCSLNPLLPVKIKGWNHFLCISCWIFVFQQQNTWVVFFQSCLYFLQCCKWLWRKNRCQIFTQTKGCGIKGGGNTITLTASNCSSSKWRKEAVWKHLHQIPFAIIDTLQLTLIGLHRCWVRRTGPRCGTFKVTTTHISSTCTLKR